MAWEHDEAARLVDEADGTSAVALFSRGGLIRLLAAGLRRAGARAYGLAAVQAERQRQAALASKNDGGAADHLAECRDWCGSRARALEKGGT